MADRHYHPLLTFGVDTTLDITTSRDGVRFVLDGRSVRAPVTINFDADAVAMIHRAFGRWLAENAPSDVTS